LLVGKPNINAAHTTRKVWVVGLLLVHSLGGQRQVSSPKHFIGELILFVMFPLLLVGNVFGHHEECPIAASWIPFQFRLQAVYEELIYSSKLSSFGWKYQFVGRNKIRCSCSKEK